MSSLTRYLPKLFAALVLGSGIILSSCIYTDVRIPGPVNSHTQFTLTSADFEILGTVEAEGTITTILGLIATGGNGYSILYDKARQMGGDEIINYTFDIEGYSILLIVYNQGTWSARATVIRYKKESIP